jgi:hypothetical protein
MTALDSSPESLDLNRAMADHNGHRIEFIVDDVLAWTAPRRYEAIVFAFWLLHVPLEAFELFWSRVDAALESDGVVGLVDSPGTDLAQRDIESLDGAPDIVTMDQSDAGVTVRKVQSGQAFPIARILWPQGALSERLEALGWAVEFAQSRDMLIGRAAKT